MFNISDAAGNPKCEALEFKWKGEDFYIKDNNMNDPDQPIKLESHLNEIVTVVYHFNTNGKNIDFGTNSPQAFKFPCNLELPNGANGKSFTIDVTTKDFADCDVIVQLVSPFFIIDLFISFYYLAWS